MSGGDWKEMFAACQSGNIDLVKYHIETGIDPNYTHPEFLTTALMESVRFKRLDIIKYLLENGADPNIKDEWTSETAISIAEAMGDEVLIGVLRG